jgi:hypothetical protein
VVVWAVKLRPGKAPDEPPEEGFVPHVHAQRDLGLLAVAPERSLSDQQADEHSSIELRDLNHTVVLSGGLFHRQEKRETRASRSLLRP